MAIITDGLLIATCLTAALYCIVLSRRLARFSDTKSGIGQQIAQLNTILEETRATIGESQKDAKSVGERLSRDLAAGKKACQDLAALIERAEAAMDRALELQSAPPAPKPSLKPQANMPAPERAPVVEAPAADTSDVSPIEEEFASNVTARDFDLADARGEPQLGFLPTVADASPMNDLTIETGEEEEDVADVDGTSADSEDEKLLKVERMAL